MISSEQKASIIAALKKAQNAGTVAREFGCPSANVRMIAKRAGIELSAGKRKAARLPLETYARIFAELSACPNAQSVARKVGCCPKTVRKVARHAKIALTVGRPKKSAVEMKRSPSTFDFVL